MKIDCFNAVEQLVQFELPRDGKLIPQLRWVLTNGHCHSFALALHRLTNWPMVGRIKQGKVEHVFCQMPDGRLADAECLMKWPEELFDACSDPRLRVLPPGGFQFSAEDGWLRSVEDVLIPFAQARLEELTRENGETVHYASYPFLNLA
jgi:hypothetical protein